MDWLTGRLNGQQTSRARVDHPSARKRRGGFFFGANFLLTESFSLDKEPRGHHSLLGLGFEAVAQGVLALFEASVQ